MVLLPTLYTMGSNADGQLGTGSTDSMISSSRMVEESISRDVDAVPVAAGTSHSLFLKSDGSLFSMGSNSKGQLGDGTINKSISPVAVKAYLLKIEARLRLQVERSKSLVVLLQVRDIMPTMIRSL